MAKSFFNFTLIAIAYLTLVGCSPLTTKDNKVIVRDTALASAAFTAWGVDKWDWFQSSPHLDSEGWFGKNTATGGSDKLGHFYGSYLLADAMHWDFKRHNIPHAASKAALASFAAMTVIEIGDSTSAKYGFSHEDLTMDALGATASWWLATHPDWDRKVDLRFEYWPSKGFNAHKDAVADYSGMKQLIAIKGDGFAALQDTPLEYLELHTGYYTRGYRSYDKGHYEKQRNSYVGIGINMAKLFGKDQRFSRVFEYYQVPGTYVAATHHHNR